MSSLMEHKGYFSNPRYSAEDSVFWGKLDGISDSISFEGASVHELQAAFIEAVEDYLDTCNRNGMVPKTPCMGRIDVTVSSELHEQLAVYAASSALSMDQAVETAIKEFLIHTA